MPLYLNDETCALPSSWDPRAEIDAAIAELQGRLAVLAKFGEDTFDDGTVITWTRTFDRDPCSTRTDKTYTYVALKADGKWWITGRQSGRPLHYVELVEDHLSHADFEDINIVTKWGLFE